MLQGKTHMRKKTRPLKLHKLMLDFFPVADYNWQSRFYLQNQSGPRQQWGPPGLAARWRHTCWLNRGEGVVFPIPQVGICSSLLFFLRPFIHGERTNTRAVQLITANRPGGPKLLIIQFPYMRNFLSYNFIRCHTFRKLCEISMINIFP